MLPRRNLGNINPAGMKECQAAPKTSQAFNLCFPDCLHDTSVHFNGRFALRLRSEKSHTIPSITLQLGTPRQPHHQEKGALQRTSCARGGWRGSLRDCTHSITSLLLSLIPPGLPYAFRPSASPVHLLYISLISLHFFHLRRKSILR